MYFTCVHERVDERRVDEEEDVAEVLRQDVGVRVVLEQRLQCRLQHRQQRVETRRALAQQ